ncbi:angiogenic factor with G patch and FHA domains 1 [Prorops nasuta]|uniref:angiogenic factor with G patch and FHA domains 1 n=1 Tax=Prorops nasuta TaxID=863751 RepID=UPI0034CE4B6C
MCDTQVLNESDEEKSKIRFQKDFSEELKNLPHVLKFIEEMKEHVKWQEKKLNKLRNKVKEHKRKKLERKNCKDNETQTELEQSGTDSSALKDWSIGSKDTSESITEQVKKVAESALQQTDFVYEETSGLYYDYKSGFYYDATQGLYYDGNSGTYYYYDEVSQKYQFHSQLDLKTNKKSLKKSENKKKKDKRKAIKPSNSVETSKNAELMEISDHEKTEEGECSTSSSEESSSDHNTVVSTNTDSENESMQDLAKIYPPCMRIIVKETSLPKLKIGSLYLVAYTGGSLGREGDHSVVISDINVSKQHAKFIYNKEKRIYEIIDLGSRNGTYLNGKRLSVAKQESEAHEVLHGSIIHVGSTKLLCHIHNGNETCGHCEPGLIQHNSNTEENKISKKSLHKQELKRLKSKFGLEKGDGSNTSQLATGYQDRAYARRKNVGSSNQHLKTQQSSIDTSIAKDNVGFKLLSKMGWSEGQSLGKDGDGRTEPVPLSANHNKAGLGAAEAEFSNIELDPNVEKKQALWRKTQQRYNEISDNQ